jgi:hypothetical protein
MALKYNPLKIYSLKILEEIELLYQFKFKFQLKNKLKDEVENYPSTLKLKLNL